jgi:hypothetical protein
MFIYVKRLIKIIWPHYYDYLKEYEKKITFLYYGIVTILFIHVDTTKISKFKIFLNYIKKIIFPTEILLPPIPPLQPDIILVLKLKVSKLATIYALIDVDKLFLKYIADVRACKKALERCAKSGLIPQQRRFYKSRDGYVCIPYHLRVFNLRWGGEKLFKLDTHGVILSNYSVNELLPYITSVIADASAGLYCY